MTTPADSVPGFPTREVAELRGRIGGLSRVKTQEAADELVRLRRKLYVLVLAQRIERAGPYGTDETRILTHAVYRVNPDQKES